METARIGGIVDGTRKSRFLELVNNPNIDFNEVIRTIRNDDPRYARGAYYFLRQALDYSLKELQKRGELDRSNHLTGQQLLEGIRLYALDQYGPMARAVMEYWGIRECRDFGNIVFNLVECHVLGKTEEDSPEDFSSGYSFHQAFESGFLPSEKPALKRPRLN